MCLSLPTVKCLHYQHVVKGGYQFTLCPIVIIVIPMSGAFLIYMDPIFDFSYCGRTVSVLTGMFGAGCTALVVAAVASKLELSSNERFVHNLITETKLSKQSKMAAANIIQCAWLIYKYKTQGKRHLVREQQKRFLNAIREIRAAKVGRMDLAENSLTLLDISKRQHVLSESLQTVTNKVDGIQATLADISNSLKHMQK